MTLWHRVMLFCEAPSAREVKAHVDDDDNDDDDHHHHHHHHHDYSYYVE